MVRAADGRVPAVGGNDCTRFAMADEGAGERPPKGPDPTDAELHERLKSLETRLGRAKRSDEPDAPKADGSLSGSAFGRAVRLSSELVAGVLVGGGLGLGFDRLAGTKPWGLIVLLMIGFAAGVLNLVRSAGLTGSGKNGGSGSPPQS